jgi:hypothetical protein
MTVDERSEFCMARTLELWVRFIHGIFMSTSFLFVLYYVGEATCGARGSVGGGGTIIQAGRSRVRVPMRWNFLSFQPHYGPGVDSASNRNEYQESSWELKGGRR